MACFEIGDRERRERSMSEASAGGSRAEMERRLIKRSLEDEEFRQSLLADPKGTMEHELGSRLPESVEVRVVEESAEIIYLVLPSRSADAQGREFSDQELEEVSGGATFAYTGGCGCLTQVC
jgi:Nitrile hydratase, alpha chain